MAHNGHTVHHRHPVALPEVFPVEHASYDTEVRTCNTRWRKTGKSCCQIAKSIKWSVKLKPKMVFVQKYDLGIIILSK